eukprot:scaffold33468_cov12-Tisochrysis_lutea.AAC.1
MPSPLLSIPSRPWRYYVPSASPTLPLPRSPVLPGLLRNASARAAGRGMKMAEMGMGVGPRVAKGCDVS